MIEDKGEILISEADDANVPVNCYLFEPDEESSKWRWLASNFMPRKEQVAEGMYEVEADTKEEIIEQIKKYVIPLYQAAITNLRSKGANYYWEVTS